MSVTNTSNINPSTGYPLNPVKGQMHIDHNGNTEIWDGSQWCAMQSASTLGGLSIGSGITLATTAFVSKSTVTFNHSDGKRQVTADEIIDFMDVMKKRMLVITEDFEKHEKYPALLQAYENYKLIERLCCGDE